MRTLVLALIICLGSGVAVAEELVPDGFGPIKFGMTPDEAWEAINGDGEWIVQDEVLDYRIQFPHPRLGLFGFSVSQKFNKGKAVYAVAEPELLIPEAPLGCLTAASYSVAYISEKYDKTPAITQYHGKASTSHDTFMYYQFHFSDYSYIELVVRVTEYFELLAGKPSDCSLLFSYWGPWKFYIDSDPSTMIPF